MSGKLQAYLDLLRIPNVFTAVADTIAGFLFVGGTAEQWRTLLLLAGASSCLYGGGVVLNDVCDVERNARERPARPIPSGNVSRRAALGLACGLLGAGFVLAATVSGRAAGIGALLVASIVLYDSLLKSTLLAPSLMGLCRALNLALAMSAAGRISSADPIAGQGPLYELVPVALIWLYVTSVTHFARREAGISERGRLLAGTIGVCFAVGGLVSLCWTVPQVHVEYLGLVVLLGVAVAYRGFAAAGGVLSREAGKHVSNQTCLPPPSADEGMPPATRIQNTVQMFVVSLVLFDTCFVWAARGAVVALAVAVLFLPTVTLGRSFRVT